MTHDPAALPLDLPVPEDDGAADHLIGAALPRVPLPSTDGDTVELAERSVGRRLVVFAYPRTGQPGQDPLPGWDDVPGARGCTPEACSFRDLATEFAERGAALFGLSTQDTDYQREAVQRLQLNYPLLSDAAFALTEALRLPTFDLAGQTFLRRLTFVARNGRIERVQYPVFPPDRAAADALALLD